MLQKRQVSIALVSAITLGLLGFGGAPANAGPNLFQLLPTVERNIFVLDISGSTNSAQLWKNTLRPSLIRKLGQPFGLPTGKGLDQNLAPVDVAIRVINAQSIDAPVFPIVQLADAAKMWGLVDDIGQRPTQGRLKLIVADFFGGNGAFTRQAAIFTKPRITPPTSIGCQSSVMQSFQTGQYMNDLDQVSKSASAKVICGLIIGIANRIQIADTFFANPKCVVVKKSCSDIVGAILNTTYAANDVFNRNSNAKFCVAIASDMLNNYPGMSATSSLNTRKIVLDEKTTSDLAYSKGRQAAEESGVRFPPKMSVRVFVLGQGTGPNPVPLDRNFVLTSYWKGFWDAAGISSSNQVRSLDQACS
jgi:hypothetical protein